MRDDEVFKLTPKGIMYVCLVDVIGCDFNTDALDLAMVLLNKRQKISFNIMKDIMDYCEFGLSSIQFKLFYEKFVDLMIKHDCAEYSPYNG